ncbi:hypothetical protein Tco_1067571 [Tanacetum coccineum]|uniref:MAK10-like protein n=1 Tax=Tanacetum coccineum TaxID=301880 RepID=A0ABQ5HD90_9ASTR
MSTTIGDENPIHNLGDYSKPSHEGYRNTIELPARNNVVPLRSDTIRLVQNGCSFHGLQSEDPNQHLKEFLKLVDSLDLDGENRERTRLQTIDQSSGGKLRDLNAKESWALLEDLALYVNESWNDPRDFAKPVKAITLPEDVPSTSDRRLIELENQVQRLMEAHLDPTRPTQVNKITTHVKSAVVPTTLSIAWKTLNKPLLNTHPRVQMKQEARCLAIRLRTKNIQSRLLVLTQKWTHNAQHKSIAQSTPSQSTPSNPKNPKIMSLTWNRKKGTSETPTLTHNRNLIHSLPSPHSRHRKLNLMLESLGLVPQSSKMKFVCSKEDDGEVLFIEIIRDDDEPYDEGPNEGEGATMEEPIVEYFDTFPTRDELTYHRRPFVEISNMTHDPPEGVVRFIREANEVAYKILHKIEQYDSLSDLEKEHTKSVYLRNEEDKRRGVEYVMSKILRFYKECLKLGPEYLTGVDDKGEVT